MDDDEISEDEAPRTLGDYARQHWYTLFPVTYVNEDSSINDLLWQQVLEQRAIRLILIWVGIVVPLVALIILIMLA